MVDFLQEVLESGVKDDHKVDAKCRGQTHPVTPNLLSNLGSFTGTQHGLTSNNVVGGLLQAPPAVDDIAQPTETLAEPTPMI